MAKRDYYEVLGVSRDAPGADIKKAYRRLAMKHHPDRNPGDKETEAHFKEAKEAYEVLSNDEKRAAYDQFGHDAAQRFGARGGRDAGDIFGDFGDIFGDIFGGARRSGAPRGADIGYNLGLSLEEAVHGVEKQLRVAANRVCEECSGSGARPGAQPATCTTCNGQGQVRMQQGFFSIQQTCPQCRGRGSVITDPCGACSGRGVVRRTRSLSVKVPAGVDNGDRIRLAGEGDSAPGGSAPGHLYVQVEIHPHPVFTRDADDLHCEVPLSLAVAALGGEVEVPALDGMSRLKVPPGTQSHKVFRLRRKGVRNVRTHETGDLYCRLVIETPVNLDRRQKELFDELRTSLEKGGKKHSPRQHSWAHKLKGFVGSFVD